jgi:ABC-2 type transport system permease protein
VFGAQTLVALVMGLVGAVVVVTLGWGIYDVSGPEAPVLFAVVFVVCALTFAAIGFALGAVVPSARAAQGIGLMSFFVMMFLSGTDGPLEVFGHTLQRVADLLPLTHVVRVLQDAWFGDSLSAVSMLTTVALGLTAALVSVRARR